MTHRVFEDDKHRWLFVMSSQVTGTDDNNHRCEVRVCRDCGRFECFGEQNGQHFDFCFELPTFELVMAAGMYLAELDGQAWMLARGMRLNVIQGQYDAGNLTEAEAKELLTGPLDPDDPSTVVDDSGQLRVKQAK